MGTLNDEILRVVGGGNIQDGLRAFYITGGAVGGGALEDLERQYLLEVIIAPVVPATNQDLWRQLFADTAIPGTYNDQALAWWTAK